MSSMLPQALGKSGPGICCDNEARATVVNAGTNSKQQGLVHEVGAEKTSKKLMQDHPNHSLLGKGGAQCHHVQTLCPSLRSEGVVWKGDCQGHLLSS
jgi:hypothetical protein